MSKGAPRSRTGGGSRASWTKNLTFPAPSRDAASTAARSKAPLGSVDRPPVSSRASFEPAVEVLAEQVELILQALPPIGVSVEEVVGMRAKQGAAKGSRLANVGNFLPSAEATDAGGRR